MTRALFAALLSLLAGCVGASRMKLDDKAAFADERANPYTFNRSVAYTLLRTNQPMEASRVIQRMLELNSDSAEPYVMLARAYIDLREFEPAERSLRTALRKDAKYASAHSMLGVLLDMKSRHEEAERSHRRAIELAPKNAGYRNNLGFSLYLRGRYLDAVHAYEAALERDSADHRIRNNLAFAYGKLGQFDKAEAQFGLAGPPAQASNNLGFLHEQRGELEPAYGYYLQAVQQDPLLEQARDNLKRVCVQLDRPVPEVELPSYASEAESPAEAPAPPAVAPAPVPQATKGSP
jgi:Flp pilus assembly protein TadD